MKPHYFGYRMIGYVDKGPLSTQFFHRNGTQFGVTKLESRAREHLREYDRFAQKYPEVEPGMYRHVKSAFDNP